MSLEEVFGVCVLVALVAFCAGWSIGAANGYVDGYVECAFDIANARRMGHEEEDDER